MMSSGPDMDFSVPRGSLAARASRSIATRLAALRAGFMERVNEVNEMTAREVMSAAASVGAIVEGASEHVVRVKQMLANLESADGRVGVTAAIERQTEALNTYFRSVSSDIARQLAASTRAQDQLKRITKAASDTSRLASAARLLALNARIEAGRVGGNGNCFSTIAGEMQHLAEQITQANQLIDSLATSLSEDLPEIARSARALREGSETLNANLSLTTRDVERETATLRNVMGQTLKETDSQMVGILSASQRALSNLQFQDAVAQGLMRYEASFYDLQRAHAEENELDDVLQDLPQPQHVEIGGEKAVDQDNAGDVLLF